jgi:hypothetical protein
MGRIEEAVQALHDAQAGFDAADHLVRSGLSRGEELFKIVLAYQTDDLERRRQLLEEVSDWMQRGRAAAQGSGFPFGIQADVRWLTGEWDAPEMEASHTRMFRVGVPMAQIRRAWYRGEADAAWAFVFEHIPEGSATPLPELLKPLGVPVVLFASTMCLEADDAESALPWLKKLDAIMHVRGGVLWQAERLLLWARYQRLTGDHDAALATAHAALVRASEPRQPYALLQAHRVLGQLTTDAGEFETAAQHFAESLALADACAFPFERALTLVDRTIRRELLRRWPRSARSVSHCGRSGC